MTTPHANPTLTVAAEPALVCRVCGSRSVVAVLDLGTVPLANSFVSADQPDGEPVFRLGMQFCRSCAIVQIPETVDPEVLFRHYLYTPSASTTWQSHCRDLSGWIRGQVATPHPFVVEPASNDGCLLRNIQNWTPNVLGIEPAVNIAEQADREGIPTIAEFFGEATARQVRASYGQADVIVGTNVLAHVPDLLDFARAARVLLKKDGIFVVEAPYLRDLIETVAYDTIYHEHVSYLSVTAIQRIYPMAGLVLTHVERTPTHGGSIRFVGRLAGARPDQSVGRFLSEEARLGYEDGSALTSFAARVERLRIQLSAEIRQLTDTGHSLAAYGATAKGNTLLTTCDIDPGAIRYIVDRNPLKQGRLAPGSHVPVVGPDHLADHPVDVLLILAWNIADEVMEQQAWFGQQGGRFLIPIPEPHFLP